MRRVAWRSHCVRSSTTRSTISRSSQWKYLPSFAAITPDAVSSCATVVSTAVGPQRRDGHGAPERHQSVVRGGAQWCGAQRENKMLRAPLFLLCPPQTPSAQRFTDEEERRHDTRWSGASDKSAAGTPRRRSFESIIGDSVEAAVVASDIVVDEAALFSNPDSKMMTVWPATFVSAPLPQTHIKLSRHVSRLLLSSLLQQTPSCGAGGCAQSV